MKFHHIGIFIKTIEEGDAFFKKILKIKKQSNVFEDYEIGVRVKFLYDDLNICYEIVAPLTKKNPVDEVINSKKNILNHIVYKTNNFDKDIEKLRSLNCIPVSKVFNAKAFGNSKVIFLLTSIGYIIELIEEKNEK